MLLMPLVCWYCIWLLVLCPIPINSRSLLLEEGSTHAQNTIVSTHFLGKSITNTKWNKAVDTLKCWSERGSWQELADEIPNYAPDFDTKANYPANSRQCWAYYTKIKGVQYPYNLSWVAEEVTCSTRYTPQWSKQSFCQIYGGKNILVVGDSLSTQFYQTLVLINTGDTSLNTVKCSYEDSNKNTIDSIINIHFIRNDILAISGVTGDKDYQHEAANPALARQYEWEPSIRELNISLLVLNRGLHYVTDDVLVTRYTLLFDYLASKYPEVTVMLRSTPVGHPGCEGKNHYIPPLESIPTDYGNLPVSEFYWREIDSQYNITSKLIETKYKNIVFFDVYKMTMLRADRHGMHYNHDCLHYCFHSVIDSWAIFFLNIGQLFTEAAL